MTEELKPFPPRVLALLHYVAERNPREGQDVFEDEHGEPMQDVADEALAWIAARELAAPSQPEGAGALELAAQAIERQANDRPARFDFQRAATEGMRDAAAIVREVARSQSAGAASNSPESESFNAQDDRKRLAILASFAHEILMGAIHSKLQADAAKHVLQLTRLMMLDDVCALNEPATGAAAPDEGEARDAALYRWLRSYPDAVRMLVMHFGFGYSRVQGASMNGPGYLDDVLNEVIECGQDAWGRKIHVALSAPKGKEPSHG